jgi:cytochrome c-type biogenesis protein CcmH
MVDWQFWAIAAAMVLASLGVVFAPLLRGAARADRRASYDMQIYRDQLREIEADMRRGVLTADEAAATRAEVARRLLAAADAEAAGAAAGSAPRRLSRLAAPALATGLALAALGLYAWLGVPGLRDLPLEARRPGQEAAEAMAAAAGVPQAAPAVDAEHAALVERLRGALEGRPDDVEGHRLLARSLGVLGRWPEARAAQARVVGILGGAAGAGDLVALAELMVLAAGGYVSPEATAALDRALALEPGDPLGRYYRGLAFAQDGRTDLAGALWGGLRAEGPPDAPWMAAVEAQLAALAPPPGPSRAEAEAAAEMPEAERQAMIEGMVAGLAERLAAQGGPPEDWARLVRSLGVLGRGDEAAAIRDEARQAFAGDAAALALIAAAAREAGLEP